jgi:hypothetical protein
MLIIPRIASFAVISAVILSVPGSAQKSTGPKAQYQMDVSTVSGFGLGAVFGGGGLGGLLGGGSNSTYTLDLRLKSATPSPTQPEKADHFFLPTAKMGKSVPLLGNEPIATRDGDYEKPKGRLLMFWGCNATAPKGQPFIIDFAKLAAGQIPAGVAEQMRGARTVVQARENNAAWWPNEKSAKQPKSGSSLRGDHRVTSGYTPEIKFSVANDYMSSLNVNASDAGAAILLGWNAVPAATGYAAWAVGGMDRAEQGGDIVMWTSANNRDSGISTDWLSPAEVQRQITAKNVMPPSQSSCQIPTQAKTAAGGMMVGSMNAFGPEENFAYPPKPADPKAVWNIDWTAQVRFRAFSSFITGIVSSEDVGREPAPTRKPKPCKGPFGIPIPGTQC